VPRGFFASFEGIDRCGKTTQAERLCATLAARGLPVGTAVAPGGLLREPGGTPLGEAVRDLLLHRRHDIDPEAEALLYAACRAQLVADVLRPALDDGRILVLDRYLDSSLAYQGHARGLGVDRVLEINAGAVAEVLPDLTILLEIDPALAAARGGDGDRIEREGSALQRLVAEGYRELAARFGERIVAFDGDRPVAELASAIAAVVVARLEAVGVR
jgi:dTMP kinase